MVRIEKSERELDNGGIVILEMLSKFGIKNPATLARLDSFARPIASRMLSPEKFISLYSKGRLTFLELLANNPPKKEYLLPESLKKKLWGLDFNCSLFNAAGMFKHGEGYETIAKQGAGAYIGGTTTFDSRVGNIQDGIRWPFASYAHSHMASNVMGLPNDGDRVNSERVKLIEKIPGCPIGWSVARMPNIEEIISSGNLVRGMWLYYFAWVDFLEVNESCPNTGESLSQNSGLASRLRYIKDNFLDLRERNFPVIVKFSNDTDPAQVPYIIDLLCMYGFDGVNFGNTSTNYDLMRKSVDKRDLKLFDYFVENFKGGVSGRPLKDLSLELGSSATEYLKKGRPLHEFHVIRTGGIESIDDIRESESAGISLNQWFTGYMEAYTKHGPALYVNTFK